MTTIHAAQALIDGHLVGPVRLELEGRRIVSVVTGDAAEQGAPADLELPTGVLTPGLLDLQNNGSFGADFAEATPQQWADVLTGLASHGVTGLEPTIITAPLAELNQAFDRIHAAQQRHAHDPVCRILGAHLEGPFISEKRKGAHRAECMLDPTPQALDTLLHNPATAAALLTITLAPERAHALEAIHRLAAQGIIVSVGHSDATAEQVWAAADAGATMTTHIFNAQRPLQHREPGVAGAVLADQRYYIGVIIDGQHLHPSTVKIVYTAAPGRAIGVTDAIVGFPFYCGDIRLWEVAMSRYRKFDEDFKAGAVQLVFETGKPIAVVARELGINEGTLGNWCAAARKRRDGGQARLSEDERAELVRLRKENTELRMQRDVLKRSVALWVDEAMGR